VNAFCDWFHNRRQADLAFAAINGIVPDELLLCGVEALHGGFAVVIRTNWSVRKRQMHSVRTGCEVEFGLVARQPIRSFRNDRVFARGEIVKV
jgi:hypothetical protein